MSLKNVQSVIERALGEPEYQMLLFSNPDLATKDYELTEAELSMLRNLAAGPYTATRRGLMETRKLVIAAQGYVVLQSIHAGR